MKSLKCHKCDYKWQYKGVLLLATCPSCKSSVKTKGNKTK